MVKYIIKRVLLGILTLFVLIAITFAMTKVMPGSPLQSKNISGDVLKKMEATYSSLYIVRTCCMAIWEPLIRRLVNP